MVSVTPPPPSVVRVLVFSAMSASAAIRCVTVNSANPSAATAITRRPELLRRTKIQRGAPSRVRAIVSLQVLWAPDH